MGASEETWTHANPMQVNGEVDPVRDYLNRIGNTPLLNAAEEVELAQRIEVGLYAAKVLELAKLSGSDDEQAAKRQEIIDDYVRAKNKVKEPASPEVVAEAGRLLTKRAAEVTHEDQFDLRRTAKAGDQAKQQMIEANLKWVVVVAKRYMGRGVPFLDLVQEGNLGLIHAVEKFDYTKGYKFSTYSTWWIRQAITRSLDEQTNIIRLPVDMLEKLRGLAKRERELTHERGRPPSLEELAKDMGYKGDAKAIADLRRYARVTKSLDEPMGEKGDTTVADVGGLAADPDAAEQLLGPDEYCMLEEAIETLSETERTIIRMRFGLEDGEPRLLQYISERIGMGTRDVGACVRDIKAKLRDYISHAQWQERNR